MTLKELLPKITHQNYTIWLQSEISYITGNLMQIQDIDDIKAHFGCPVIAINDDWSIIIQADY